MLRSLKAVFATRPTPARRARLGLEGLEAREVPGLLAPTTTKVLVPDYAGDSMATARTVSPAGFKPQTLSDALPSSADADYYRVNLNQGDYLVADVDATGSTALGSTLAVLNASGGVIASNRYGTEPESGRSSVDPALGFYAPTSGTYYVRLTTTATDYSTQRGYSLNLERVGVNESQAASALAQGGAYHAWLNQAGDTLTVTGPSGYGFSLRGAWSVASSGSTTTYSATGTVYLKTSALAGSVGEVALAVGRGETFTVTTNTPGWAQLGELASVGGHLGLSLAPAAGLIRDAFGLDVSSEAVLNGWTIKTGEQIRQAYHGVDMAALDQVLDGVPYLVYGAAGKTHIEFGSVSLNTTDQATTLLIADPADPFLYVQYGDYAAAGSVHGRIPFNTSVVPPGDTTTLSTVATGRTGYYGHVYASGSFPIADLPLSVAGEVTVNLDANGDGQFLGGAGTANQLLRGEFGALDAVARDVNVGINGSLNLGYRVAGYAVTVPLGQASAFYSGPQQGVFFQGAQGTALNPWAGTVLADFQAGPGAAVEGYAYRDGRFSVSTTSNYRLLAADAALTLTVTDHDISATGTLTTPIASAAVTGTIDFDGTFSWTGTARVDVGGGSNFIKGDCGFVLTRTAAGMVFDLDLNCQAKLSISGAKAEGTLTGHLKLVMDNSGQVTYDASLSFSVGVYVYDPLFQRWRGVGAASGSVALSGNHLSFSACGYGFSIDLP